MRIGLDVMGGDYAPDATIDGAILSLKELDSSDRVVLFGDETTVRNKLQERGIDKGKFEVVHAPEVIKMGEQPMRAFSNKPFSSIAIGFKHLKSRDIDTFASAGNSGAMVVGSIQSVNNIDGIYRPCTSVALPTENGEKTVLLDIGTNPDPKPEILYQFGAIGSVYAKYILNIESPRVGLLNIGEEEEKGNMLTQSTYKLMDGSGDFNFIGNVEGRDILRNKADVIVCDGFTGNVVLKQIEAMYEILIARGFSDAFIKDMNFENYGGTPILGINGSVVVGHGISNDIAIKNMILLSRNIHEAKLYKKLREAFARISESV